MNNIWVIEAKLEDEYVPVYHANSRDDARNKQKAYKLLGKLQTPSRIRSYLRDESSRG